MTSNFLKDRDAWFTVIFIDFFATPLAKISNKYIKYLVPDHFTFFSVLSFSIGLIFLFKDNVYLSFLFFILSSIFDCVDGKLARLSNSMTAHGKVVDALGDLFCHSFGFLGVSLWYYNKDMFIVSFIVFLWAILFGIGHIKSISNNNKIEKKVSDGRWNNFCKSHRLINRPVSEVEIAFLIIPISICFINYSLFILMFFSILCVSLKFLIKSS